MFGYAVDETESYMPAPIYYSHRILKEMSNMRHNGKADFLGPDSKSQLSIEYEGSTNWCKNCSFYTACREL